MRTSRQRIPVTGASSGSNRGIAHKCRGSYACAAERTRQVLAPCGIRVHCPAPGMVVWPKEPVAEILMGAPCPGEQQASCPPGIGSPEDVPNMAPFQPSEQARWVTEQNFVCGGGRY